MESSLVVNDLPVSNVPISNISTSNDTLTLDDIFVNLRVLSKLEIGNKLIKNNKYLNIDTSYLQFFYRWYNGINRNNTIEFIIPILDKAFEISDQLIELKSEESAQLLYRLNTELKNSVNGLLNLKQTYNFDKLIQSEIDVMIDNIRTKLDISSKNFNFVNLIMKSPVQEKKNILLNNSNNSNNSFCNNDKNNTVASFCSNEKNENKKYSNSKF